MTGVDPLAKGLMVAYCGWDPTEVVADRTVLLNGNGAAMLTLPSLYVRDVSAVVVTPRDEFDWQEPLPLTVGPAGQVNWSEDGCLVLRNGALGRCFPVGERNVSVTYSGGYTETPADLDAALAHLGKRVPTMGLKSERMLAAGFTYVGDGDLLLVERLVLDKYRIVRAA